MFLRPLLQWSTKRKTSNANTPINNKPAPLHIPIEVWIEIIHHLQHDSYSLRQLSLVSPTMRTLTQKVLFQRINLIRARPETLYHKFCQCGKSKHRHVLTYVRELSILISNNNTFTATTWTLKSSSHPATLIQHMTNLEYLTIRIDISSRKGIHPLWTLPLNLKGLFLYYKGPFQETDQHNILNFLSKQTNLKQLDIIFNKSPFKLTPNLFPQKFDFISIHSGTILYEKTNFTGAYIDPRLPSNRKDWVTQEERLETKLRLVDVESAFICFDHLKQVNLDVENVEFLWVPLTTYLNIDRYLSKFINLKFLILEPKPKGYEIYEKRLAFMKKLFSMIPSLEKIGYNDLVLKVWTRGGVGNGEIWDRGRDERVDFYSRCQEFDRLNDTWYCVP